MEWVKGYEIKNGRVNYLKEVNFQHALANLYQSLGWEVNIEWTWHKRKRMDIVAELVGSKDKLKGRKGGDYPGIVIECKKGRPNLRKAIQQICRYRQECPNELEPNEYKWCLAWPGGISNKDFQRLFDSNLYWVDTSILSNPNTAKPYLEYCFNPMRKW